MSPFAEAESAHNRERRRVWEESHAQGPRLWLGRAYHRRLAVVFRFLIPKESKVLELGCGRGDLLASLKPAFGVGLDFSFAACRLLRTRHPSLSTVNADAHHLPFKPGVFDSLILSDLAGDLWDVQGVLNEAARIASPRMRLCANFHSRVWEPLLWLAQKLGLARRRAAQNWVTAEDFGHLLRLSGWEPLRHWTEVLLPVSLPPFSTLANRVFAKLWPFRAFALSNFLVARPRPAPASKRPTFSVVIPVRNEEGHVDAIFSSLPEPAPGDEYLFVEGNSSDRTYAAVKSKLASQPGFPGRLLKQTGKGKADAVRAGFTAARGDILAILDGDLTVAAEMLPRFYEALRGGEAEFANGVRLLYPMEKEAMRPLNFLANKFFSLAFSWLLGQPVKDTLCGTKVLWRADYERLVKGRAYFGEFDPFGDFDLLFGAAKLNLKIADIPVRYLARRYGETNISRFSDGFLLLKMAVLAARRIKFI